MIECLKEQKKQLSQRCHQRIFRLQEVEMTDPELDYQLMRVCKQMIKVTDDDALALFIRPGIFSTVSLVVRCGRMEVLAGAPLYPTGSFSSSLLFHSAPLWCHFFYYLSHFMIAYLPVSCFLLQLHLPLLPCLHFPSVLFPPFSSIFPLLVVFLLSTSIL